MFGSEQVEVWYGDMTFRQLDIAGRMYEVVRRGDDARFREIVTASERNAMVDAYLRRVGAI